MVAIMISAFLFLFGLVVFVWAVCYTVSTWAKSPTVEEKAFDEAGNSGEAKAK